MKVPKFVGIIQLFARNSFADPCIVSDAIVYALPASFTQKSVRAALTSLYTESPPHTQRSHSDIHRRQHSPSA